MLYCELLVEISCGLVFQFELFFCPIIYRRYQIIVGFKLKLLNELNKFRNEPARI